VEAAYHGQHVQEFALGQSGRASRSSESLARARDRWVRLAEPLYGVETFFQPKSQIGNWRSRQSQRTIRMRHRNTIGCGVEAVLGRSLPVGLVVVHVTFLSDDAVAVAIAVAVAVAIVVDRAGSAFASARSEIG
jgi:hypothetical protein